MSSEFCVSQYSLRGDVSDMGTVFTCDFRTAQKLTKLYRCTARGSGVSSGVTEIGTVRIYRVRMVQKALQITHT